jgi:hypothetical protein
MRIEYLNFPDNSVRPSVFSLPKGFFVPSESLAEDSEAVNSIPPESFSGDSVGIKELENLYVLLIYFDFLQQS